MSPRRRVVLPLLASVLALTLGCPRAAHEGASKELLSDIRTRLSERDAKLQSYSFTGTTSQAGNEAQFEFAYRTPNRMRGTLVKPVERTFSFDGEKLFELVPSERRYIAYTNRLPKEQSALFLARTFSPFVPEGFRAPLIPREGATVERVKHPKAAEAVEIRVEAVDETAGKVRVAYTLRLPSMDFLGKRTEAGGKQAEVRVEEERCDEALRLCVPIRLSQWTDGTQEATTALSRVELNPALPADAFKPTVPEGFAQTTHELVEQK